ncbi:hypothetical protein K466DRAFT_606014 [Polyporus arcularius HHB13444]|uniref:Peptidase C14 caspase domain-containing protein n=1 Tax=Polyporus arcularius HHB13444 TaxID=1314778 RepID=A0A5C3NSS0_9APHY|nr:hypothetical protein K466DRAFT_606014 [Polyporus arcularius HHB13444]
MSKLLRRLTQPSSTLHAPAESRREPTKKALIIGINYVAHEKKEMKLRGAHDDARGWMKLCIETYGFPESDITLMLDDDSVTAELRPTRANILHQINEFVEGVQPGDHLVFFYSGHSGQVESKSMNEDDGLDEVLMPLDNEGVSPQSADKLILDDELRRLLVDPLPVGSTLTAIFDSCHSGTLLDLDHYLCNNIWFPFMSRGKRQTRSRCMAVSRRNGLNVQHVPISQAAGKDDDGRRARSASGPGVRIHQFQRKLEKVLSIDTALELLSPGPSGTKRFSVTTGALRESVIRAPSSPLPSSKPFPSRRTTLERAQSFASVVGDMTATGFLDLVRFSSPEEMVNLCNGFDCKNSDEPKARAFSFSACRDPEETFDGPRGRSMTKTMIEVLEKNPHPTYRELLHHVGHKLYGVRRIIQEKNNKNMQKRKQGKNLRLAEC